MTNISSLKILATLAVALFALPAPAAHAIDKPSELREITVGVPAAFPPYFLVDTEGHPSGFGIDVMEAVAARAGVKVRYRAFKSNLEYMAALQNGTVDVLPSLGVSKARQQELGFTRPIDTFRISLFVRKNTADVEGLEDLSGLPVGVVIPNLAHRLLSKREDVNLITFDDVPSALFALLSARIDGLAYPERVAWKLARDAGIDDLIKVAPTPIVELKRAMAVRKGDTALLAMLDSALSDFIASKDYRRMYTAWFGAPQAFWTVSRILWLMAAVIVVLITAMAWWRHLSNVKINTSLQESEARYRDLIEGSELGIQIGSRHKGRIYANKACAELFGYDSIDELLERPRYQLVAACDKDRITGYRDALYRGDTVVTNYEMDGVRKDGSIVPVQVFLRRIAWEGEDAIQRTFIDLTARRQAEQSQRESEERLKAITDHSPSLIYLKDTDSRILKINPAYENTYDVTEKEALGSQGHEWLGRENAERLKAHDQKVISSKQPVESEFEITRSDGKVSIMQSVKFPVLDQEERIIGIGGIGIDITERKQAEEALRESEERFSSVFNNSPAAISLKDTDGRFRLVNTRYLEWFGVNEEDVLGKTPAEVLPSEQASVSMAHDRRTLDSGKVTEREQEIDFGSGQKVLVLITKFPVLNRDGKPIGIGTIMTDVSEERKTAAQLRQAQKMEAVGQLTGGVAHDFNNLLTVIHGNLELIAERVEDSTVSRMAESAINASRRGADLTQRLLAFSRKQTLAPTVLEMDQLISGMTELLRRTLGETIEIEVTRGDDLWRCEVDPGQLESAILNLALNARDAMPAGGKLTIETSNVKLTDSDVAARNDVSSGEYVLVSVSDTGTGMSRDAIDHAFEPFFTTKDVGAGSGLGLSMVHGFINQSGGFVAIDSAEGVGTSVNLYLPKSVKTFAPARQSLEGKDSLSQGEKVLVVEDNPDVRALTVNMLADLGYNTVEAADGKEAIEMLQQTPGIDLLFTDVGLPGGMSGIDVAREVIQHFPNINILFTSGYGDDVLARHGGLDANAELVHKPFRKEELAQKLRAAMGQSLN